MQVKIIIIIYNINKCNVHWEFKKNKIIKYKNIYTWIHAYFVYVPEHKCM